MLEPLRESDKLNKCWAVTCVKDAVKFTRTRTTELPLSHFASYETNDLDQSSDKRRS